MRPNKLNITLEPGQKVWFTSDLHFGHDNVCRFAQRPWANAKDMGVGLITNWNEVVGEDDIVFVLGDMFWFHGRHDIKRCVNKLNGTIYVIPGNHDKLEAFELSTVKLLDGITVLHLQDGGSRYEIWMSHYPMLTWPHPRTAMQLFGHIHSRGDGEFCEFGKILPIVRGRQYDVGVDRNRYKPISLEEILEKLKLQEDWSECRSLEDMYF